MSLMKNNPQSLLYTLILVALVMLASCKKHKDDPAPTTTTTTTQLTKYYFQGTYDNKSYTMQTSLTANGYNNGVESSTSSGYDDQTSGNYTYDLWSGTEWAKLVQQGTQINTQDALVMELHKKFHYTEMDEPSDDEINAMFAVGTYTNFATLSTQNSYETTEGWDVQLTSDTTTWTTYNGSADQTGSYMKIESQKIENINGQKTLTLKGSVQCKLYDSQGNVKTLNGTFNQLFSTYED